MECVKECLFVYNGKRGMDMCEIEIQEMFLNGERRKAGCDLMAKMFGRARWEWWPYTRLRESPVANGYDFARESRQLHTRYLLRCGGPVDLLRLIDTIRLLFRDISPPRPRSSLAAQQHLQDLLRHRKMNQRCWPPLSHSSCDQDWHCWGSICPSQRES
jgi:hypothetical protein